MPAPYTPLRETIPINNSSLPPLGPTMRSTPDTLRVKASRASERSCSTTINTAEPSAMQARVREQHHETPRPKAVPGQDDVQHPSVGFLTADEPGVEREQQGANGGKVHQRFFKPMRRRQPRHAP